MNETRGKISEDRHTWQKTMSQEVDEFRNRVENTEMKARGENKRPSEDKKIIYGGVKSLNRNQNRVKVK